MAFDLLIRGARLIRSDLDAVGDVGITDGKISAIGELGGHSTAEVLDAKGLALLPGVIDTQVHFREPGLEWKEDIESGTRSALYGGATSILEMPNTIPPTIDETTLADKLQRAEGRAWCHYGFFIGATGSNVDQLGKLESLPGVPGIKIFVGSSTGALLVDNEDVLRRVLMSGSRPCPVHAEDEARNRERKSLISHDPHPREHPLLRDEVSAVLATQKVIRLSAETGRRVHILHVSTAQEPPVIYEAKQAGIKVTAEVTPQHLYFAAPECYEKLGSLAQMNPPIRSAEHREALWRALDAGIFDVFGSDHAPHTLDEKSQPYPLSPSGLPGVQTMLPILLSFAAQGRISLSKIALMACENPARLYGIVGKGRMEVGMDADLTLVDHTKSYVFERSMVQSKCGWSPYEGEQFTGSVEHVLIGGRFALRDGEHVGGPSGRMLAFQ
jgi:dihydroorotase